MKNETKFRAWHRDYKEMLPWGRMGPASFNNEDYVVMQYMGQKDANGVEIYEGDIVEVVEKGNLFQVKRGEVEREVVMHHGGTIRVQINCFYFENIKTKRPCFSVVKNHFGGHDLEKTVVVGNIFENSELLG